MVDYLNIIYIGLAMVCIMMVGFICGKLKIISKEGAGIVNRYTFKVCFLPVIARMLTSKKFSTINWWPLLISTLMAISTNLTLALCCFLPMKDKLGTYVTSLMPANYINYVVSGIPIFSAIWDASESSVVSIMTLSNDLLTNPTYLVLGALWTIRRANIERKQRGEPEQKFSFNDVKLVLYKLSQSPILQGNAFGLIYAATGLPMPTFLSEVLKLAGDVVLPMSLFCVGVFLSYNSLISCHWLKFILLVLIRHFVAPAWAILYCYLFHLPGKISRQCVVMVAQPTGAAAYLVAEALGAGQGVASTMVFWTAIICIPAIIFWLWLFDAVGLFVE